MTAVGIAPSGGLVDPAGFERAVGRLLHGQAIGAVERLADFAPHPRAKQRTGRDGRELARSFAELGAEQAAGDGADESPAGFLLAPVLGAGGNRAARDRSKWPTGTPSDAGGFS